VIVAATTAAPTGPRDRASVFSYPKRSDPGAPVSSGQIAESAPGSDESLLAGLVSGDAELEVAFIRRFQDRVYGLARRLVGETPLAEDVAQEAFLRAWRHARSFDPTRGSVTTWLLAITRNLAIDALRRRRAVPVPPDLLVGLGLDAQTKGPDELAVDADTRSRVRELIENLPAEQRRAVLLAFFYGQTAQEISITEGIPLGSAKTRIRLGMIKLRAATPAETAAR
jgi:RNA polymerase sigma factor (sigma-70 family)